MQLLKIQRKNRAAKRRLIKKSVRKQLITNLHSCIEFQAYSTHCDSPVTGRVQFEIIKNVDIVGYVYSLAEDRAVTDIYQAKFPIYTWHLTRDDVVYICVQLLYKISGLITPTSF